MRRALRVGIMGPLIAACLVAVALVRPLEKFLGWLLGDPVGVPLRDDIQGGIRIVWDGWDQR